MFRRVGDDTMRWNPDAESETEERTNILALFACASHRVLVLNKSPMAAASKHCDVNTAARNDWSAVCEKVSHSEKSHYMCFVSAPLAHLMTPTYCHINIGQATVAGFFGVFVSFLFGCVCASVHGGLRARHGS